jgi:MoaA/NifB/PqqE/SkfB family radical SAM enzyme
MINGRNIKDLEGKIKIKDNDVIAIFPPIAGGRPFKGSNMLDDDFPEALQVEVTNRCNFNCQMCIRRVWEARLQDLNLDLYEKIAKSSFPLLKKLILYGLGEPLVNPNFPEMLRIARKHLPKDSTITISTNGSLLTPEVAKKS